VCRSADKKPNKSVLPKAGKTTNYVGKEERPTSPSSNDDSYTLFTLSERSTPPYLVDIILNDAPVKMEVDTGASLSVINEATYNRMKAQHDMSPLQPSLCKLRTYTGEDIKVLGTMDIKAVYGETELYLPIHVVNGGGPNLMGRDWLSQFEVNLGDIRVVEPSNQLQEVLDKFADVFSGELGCLKGQPVKLLVPENATPKFFKARPVPFLLKEKVEEELNNLQSQGIISPVKFSRWAAPIVPVVKKNGKVRICGDFKVTINKVAPTETYCGGMTPHASRTSQNIRT